MDERRLSVLGATSAVKWYVVGVVVLASLTIASVSVIAIFAPDTTAIATVIGFSTPLAFALLSGGLHRMAVAIDGKLSQLVGASEDRARLIGLLEGLKKNPDTNIS